MLWKAITGFLYFELFICLLLLFPIIAAKRWKTLLHSQLVSTIWSYSKFYFYAFAIFLVGLCIAAGREMQKHKIKKTTSPEDETTLILEKMFRAQRNFFISMFAALLIFILNRIGSLILSRGTLEVDIEESNMQIKIAADMVTRASLAKQEFTTQEKELFRLELCEAKNEMSRLKEEIIRVEKDKGMMSDDLERSRREFEELHQENKDLKASHALKKD